MKDVNCFDNKKVNISIDVREVKCGNSGIPGVFNCRFANSAVTSPKRKKKKPTTFVPPPSQHQSNSISLVPIEEAKQWLNGNGSTRQLIPFWKRPLTGTSTNHVRFFCL